MLVPPEVIELGDSNDNEGEGEDGTTAPPVKKEDWPEYFLKLFDAVVSAFYAYGFVGA